MRYRLIAAGLIWLLHFQPLTASAQKSDHDFLKPVTVWVYTGDSLIIGKIKGTFRDSLFLENGSITALSYRNIKIIKTRKKNAALKPILYGVLIGISPIVFGQAGAFIAVITLPVGILTGTIIGLSAKKKFRINGDLQAFHHFIETISH